MPKLGNANAGRKQRRDESDADFAARVDEVRAADRERQRQYMESLRSDSSAYQAHVKKRNERQRELRQRRRAERRIGEQAEDALRLLERQRKADDPERIRQFRAWDRARRKGMTAEQVEALRESQGGKCAVCGREPRRHRDGRDGLYIDHRHDNGAVRGMICSRCNWAVSIIDNDLDLLGRLLEYAKIGAGTT